LVAKFSRPAREGVSGWVKLTARNTPITAVKSLAQLDHSISVLAVDIQRRWLALSSVNPRRISACQTFRRESQQHNQQLTPQSVIAPMALSGFPGTSGITLNRVSANTELPEWWRNLCGRAVWSPAKLWQLQA